MSPAALGALLGLAAGTGAWWAVLRLAARRPTLDARLAPYLRPAPEPPPAASVLERLLAPVMRDAVRLVERLGSPTAELERRLARAGEETGVEEYRARQVVAAALGTAGGLALALAVAAARGLVVPAALAVVAGGTAAGVVVHDALLGRRIRERERRLLAELPTVAELIALAVAAGEGALGALERVARTVRGELAGEIGRVVADAHAGTPLAVALDRLAVRTGVPALTRFTEGIAVAVERGTPLADVLRAQADDAREAGRRELIESGGRKEIAMLVPVVFLVLPVTVVFAVFPGLATLRIDL